ncbi:MAG TPA: 6-carboxytetrahydropterin synthase [Gemmatimonadales bacterium]|nr:6-carboxytetrahydropterin synthase [Gemmatimonadales bacterium]
MELLSSDRGGAPTVRLTRIVEFHAGHEIRRADWTPEQNAEHFGRASQLHSHTYQCRVTVSGALHPTAGGVVRLAELDALLKREVTDRFEGKTVHEGAPEFGPGGWLSTGEALSVYLWGRISGALPPGVRLHAIRVQEGPQLYSEYFGESAGG